MLVALAIISVITSLYFLNKNYKYWIIRGIPGPKPIYLVGNLGENFLLKKSLDEVHSDIYKKFPDAPMVGFFKLGTPSLIIRDPELIKDVMATCFHNFQDSSFSMDKNINPLAGRHPLFLKGKEWKDTRMRLTPVFTSGKMKWSYPLLVQVGKDFAEYIAKRHTSTTDEGCNSKELCMRFTLNNVGSCAFGLDAKCFEEENPEFKQIADRFLNPKSWYSFKLIIATIIPSVQKIVSLKFTPQDVDDKVTSIVRQTLKYRQENNIVRNDFMHLMLQMVLSKECTEEDATAHAATFFVDGYETSSIAMHFLLYELASHHQVQKKLREEISKAFEENNDELPYETLQSLSYLDAVFKEALRLYPPAGFLDRVCTKPYTYIPKDDDTIKKSFVIEAGTSVVVPVPALHRDPKYYNDPDSFKPERFLDADKKHSSYTFLPFGAGPRTCLGQQFGSLQIKVGVAYIIKNYEISVNKKTQLPIKYDPLYFLILPKNGLWLDFKKI